MCLHQLMRILNGQIRLLPTGRYGMRNFLCLFSHVSVDWDPNPRYYDYKSNIKNGVNPGNFIVYLEKAKPYLDARPDQYKRVTITSWNEWSEGSYLEPDTDHGMGDLEAMKQVFKDNYVVNYRRHGICRPARKEHIQRTTHSGVR
jgi:hypothetical protein